MLFKKKKKVGKAKSIFQPLIQPLTSLTKIRTLVVSQIKLPESHSRKFLIFFFLILDGCDPFSLKRKKNSGLLDQIEVYMDF